jgi:hypothetical protein
MRTRFSSMSPSTRLALSLVLIAAGCGSSSSDNGGGGSGGASASGGASTGGTSGGSGGAGTGGTTAGGSGGQSSTGGAATGGAATGGAATGGAATGGAATGGASSTGSGGMTGTGGAGSGGKSGSGGSTTGGRGGGESSGGATGSGGAGGRAAGGSGAGGTTSGSGGASGGGGSKGGGTCTASKSANSNASGTGPHKVVVETNGDPGINEGTIFRPMDLGGAEKYPIFVWGEGGCSKDGLSNAAAMAEIASHGYFVIADGKPNGSGNRSQTNDVVGMGKPLIAYIDWAIAENGKACSAYYQALDTTKIGANGFSCGGLMSEGTAGDPRLTTWGLNSSGLISANTSFYKTIHTPVLIVLGGSDDIAYQNGERDYDNISALGIPIMLFSKQLGHGGDLFSSHGGDFTKIDLAWLNWRLKGDETATGKGRLVGAGCTYCTDSAWEVKSKNID